MVQLVEYWRDRLGINGMASASDAWALAEALELQVWRVPGMRAHLCVAKQWVILPTGMDREEEARVLLEEIGHWLYREWEFHGLSRRGYLLGDGKSESPAHAFALYWLFAGASGRTDDDLAAERGCPLNLVVRFRQIALCVV